MLDELSRLIEKNKTTVSIMTLLQILLMLLSGYIMETMAFPAPRVCDLVEYPVVLADFGFSKEESLTPFSECSQLLRYPLYTDFAAPTEEFQSPIVAPPTKSLDIQKKRQEYCIVL